MKRRDRVEFYQRVEEYEGKLLTAEAAGGTRNRNGRNPLVAKKLLKVLQFPET